MAQCFGDIDWQSIAEQVSNELDPAKLSILVEKLCGALDSAHRPKSQFPAASGGNEPRSFVSD
jgi:hypothetical protein